MNNINTAVASANPGDIIQFNSASYDFQGQGLGLVLVDALVPAALDWGMEEAEFSWVAESNSLSRGSLEKGGAKRTKTYRVYDLA